MSFLVAISDEFKLKKVKRVEKQAKMIYDCL